MMWNNLKNGFIKDNPVFSMFLGLCSALAVSLSLNNAVGMGVCVTLVLIFSNVIISLLRKFIPSQIRIPVYIVIIASLVTIVEMLVHAYAPGLYRSLGVFLSLVVVNCIILGRAEAFASKNPVLPSAIDGLGMGLGYTFALVLLSTVREFLATGAIVFKDPFNSARVIFELSIEAFKPYTIPLVNNSVGAFLVFACFAALFSMLKEKIKLKEKEAGK
ncbi:MAG: electron transport complex subunit RsxE [Erysipelotrichaceae bacterium]|nr:electron transport complex subunit RsxE [Erysipelotrichaceae bacterium]